MKKIQIKILGLSTYIGEHSTVRIRKEIFKKILFMHVGWFDLPKNTPGNLSTKLETDADLIAGFTA